MTLFVGNGTKVKIPSEVKPPLQRDIETGRFLVLMSFEFANKIKKVEDSKGKLWDGQKNDG